MHKIYWTNFDYYSQDEFYSFGAALNYGKSKGMEFQIHAQDGTPLASYSPIGGFRDLVQPQSQWEGLVRTGEIL